MLEEKNLKIEENQGNNYDYLMCPYCLEESLELKNKRAEKTQKNILNHSVCKSDNKYCPHKQKLPKKYIKKQYGKPPKENLKQKIKRLNQEKLIKTIIIPTIIVLIALIAL